jgi:glycosyltransferase involved in cell wall biosynthesis
MPSVCSDERNLAWGLLRNNLADYQCALGGNRKDYNDDPRVHEVPEFYCLDTEFWRPDLPVPRQYWVSYPEGTVRLFHAVGNFDKRTAEKNVNLKSTHIYVPLIKRLKAEGYEVELMFLSNIPNKEVRFYQAQGDICVDMLTYGFFGANAREAMMLGKPVVCFLRPEWLESMRREIPEYVQELPVISATPSTVYEVLKDLIEHPEKCAEIGRRSREFAVKWHSAEAGARRFDRIYSGLLHGELS